MQNNKKKKMLKLKRLFTQNRLKQISIWWFDVMSMMLENRNITKYLSPDYNGIKYLLLNTDYNHFDSGIRF